MPLWASVGFCVPLWASVGFCGLLWSSVGGFWELLLASVGFCGPLGSRPLRVRFAAARGRYTGVNRLFVSVRAAPGEAAATLKGQHQQKSDRRAWSLSAVRREVCEPAQTWNQPNKETINNETIKLMPILIHLKRKTPRRAAPRKRKKTKQQM